MNLNKKVVESMTVASALLVMSTTAALGGSAKEGLEDVLAHVEIGEDGVAGIAFEFQKMNQDVLANSSYLAASIEKVQKTTVSENGGEEIINTQAAAEPETPEGAELVKEEEVSEGGAAGAGEIAAVALEQGMDLASAQAEEDQKELPEEAAAEASDEAAPAEEEVKAADASEETAAVPEETPQEQPGEEAQWANLVMANVEEDMNIRTAPDANSEPAGKFYRGDVAEVIAIEGEWTQISSGNASGYVKNEYLVYGADASQFANEVCSLYATVNADGLRLRSEPSEEAGVVTTAKTGEKLKVDKEAAAADGWVAVYTSDATAYVSAEYVDVALNLGTALNSEEVAAKEAEEAKAAEAAKKPAVSANADEVTLLGALIQCEAGNSSYEGMLAIGAVVMNRVRSGSYPGSVSGVIYQAGQFPPALNGSVANVAASGVRSACLQAAREALAGADNTNGALSFRSASSGCQGAVIGGNVFF